jgi:hypothetical protein
MRGVDAGKGAAAERHRAAEEANQWEPTRTF